MPFWAGICHWKIEETEQNNIMQLKFILLYLSSRKLVDGMTSEKFIWMLKGVVQMMWAVRKKNKTKIKKKRKKKKRKKKGKEFKMLFLIPEWTGKDQNWLSGPDALANKIRYSPTNAIWSRFKFHFSFFILKRPSFIAL